MAKGRSHQLQKKSTSRKHRHAKQKKRHKRTESISSSASSASPSSINRGHERSDSEKKVLNERLMAKLAARGETLEERNQRRSQKRAAHISATLGYTADDNPFNDPNIHETFTWKKREETTPAEYSDKPKKDKTLEEIEKVRRRRKDRENQFDEMQRIRAEESRMKELENYDDWARKEEEFHLHQQKQRSAIRLVEGREKPIDVLAKNLLLFGLSEEDKKKRSSLKYQERYNALEALQTLEAELEDPHIMLKMLKLNELEELLVEIDMFRSLERDALSTVGVKSTQPNQVLQYWDALHKVAQDEIKYLKSGGDQGSHAKIVVEVQKVFKGQSFADLAKMKDEVASRIRVNRENSGSRGTAFDVPYWQSVVEQLDVYLAKCELSDLHSKMLVRQLDKLEREKEELARDPEKLDINATKDAFPVACTIDAPKQLDPGSGELEEELGLTSEVAVSRGNYAWEDKYRPRKPRYFNRVKTGYDWNKYNQTHYDQDNPPPKTVQGYKFNIFYPDLIDPTKTPQFILEGADTDEFCILRFCAGPPYEDIAFKIINREWNRSRKRGYKCSFERGVLSLYFNFATHWYRR